MQLPAFAILAGLSGNAIAAVYERWRGKNAPGAALALWTPVCVLCFAIFSIMYPQSSAWRPLVRHLHVKDSLHYLSREMHSGDSLIVAPGRDEWRFDTIMLYYISSPSPLFHLPLGTSIHCFKRAEDMFNPVDEAKGNECGNFWFIAPTWKK